MNQPQTNDIPPLELREAERLTTTEVEAQRLLVTVQAAALAAASRPLEPLTEAQQVEMATKSIRLHGATDIVYRPGDGERAGCLEYRILVPRPVPTVTMNVELVEVAP